MATDNKQMSNVNFDMDHLASNINYHKTHKNFGNKKKETNN